MNDSDIPVKVEYTSYNVWKFFKKNCLKDQELYVISYLWTFSFSE